MASAYQIDLQSSRSIGEILLTTLAAYRRYPLLFAILALTVMAPYELAVLAITGYGPLVKLAHQHREVFWATDLLKAAFITSLISALHLHAVVAIGDGRRPQIKAVALRGISVLPVVGATALITNVAVAVGTAFFILPGIWILLSWAVAAQAAALEQEGPVAAIRSSSRLTSHRYWHIFGLLAIIFALSTALTLAARAIPLGSTSGVASVCVGIALDTLLASFGALSLALLYFDLRARPERQRKRYQAADATT